MSSTDERQAQRAVDIDTLHRAADRLEAVQPAADSVEAALIPLFRQWARLGRLGGPDYLARVGGAETAEVARRVLATTPDHGG